MNSPDAPAAQAPGPGTPHGASGHPCHREHLVRLSRVEGQIRGIARMIDDGKYCIDIIGQLRAARSALAAVEAKVLARHIKTCLHDAFDAGNEELVDAKVDELVDFILRSGK